MSHILTIDDGPTTDATRKIDYLNAHDIPSIWFCLGENLERNSDAALHAIRTGHVVANHSYSHPHFSEITIAGAVQEIERTEVIIDRLYVQSGILRPAKLFRFPYGDQGQNKDGEISNDADRVKRKADLQRYLTRHTFRGPNVTAYKHRKPFISHPGEIDWLWSYDIQEWATHNDDPKYHLTQDQVTHNLRQHLKSFDRNKDQIILTHDHVDTSLLFPQLIDAFMKAGVEFRLPEF